MHKQRTLPLTDEIPLDGLWEHFPEPNRHELVTLYARLMACVAIELSKPSSRKGRADEKTGR